MLFLVESCLPTAACLIVTRLNSILNKVRQKVKWVSVFDSKLRTCGDEFHAPIFLLLLENTDKQKHGKSAVASLFCIFDEKTRDEVLFRKLEPKTHGGIPL